MFAIEKSKSDLWFDRIMECRSSGLCDSRWCQENNLKLPTFYYWVKKLRIERSPEPPVSSALSLRKEQEVVPIHITENICKSVPSPINKVEENYDTTVSIEKNSLKIHIKNNASPSVIQATLQALRLLC